MKNSLIIVLISLMLSACASTGPAEDLWDREEKEDKIDLGSIFKGKAKKGQQATQQENEALRARIERLERQQGLPASAATSPGGDITAPPALGSSVGGAYQPANPQGSVSYQEWLRAKQSNSDQYKDFKEYQEWLEFQKINQKP